MTEKWIRIDYCGQLYQEFVLIYFDVPELFVCINDKKERYLTLCIDPEEGRYVLIRISPVNIIRLIDGKITMEKCFSDDVMKDCIITKYNNEKKTFEAKVISTNSLPQEMKPDEGVFYSLSSDYIEKYKQLLKGEVLVDGGKRKFEVVVRVKNEKVNREIVRMGVKAARLADRNIKIARRAYQHLEKRKLLMREREDSHAYKA